MSGTEQKHRATSQTARKPKYPVELASIEVNGLFGNADIAVEFPHSEAADNEPALVLLHGRNGVGKTTLLLMLDGMIRLDFDIFRVRPFMSCVLAFSDGPRISVSSEGIGQPLLVRYGNRRLKLHPRNKGAFDPRDEPAVGDFRQAFRTAIRDVRFQLITTARMPTDDDRESPAAEYIDYTSFARGLDDSPELRLRARLRNGPPEERTASLSSKVRRFMLDAQVDYRAFFETHDDLFDRIFQVIQSEVAPPYDPRRLLEAAETISRLDRTSRRLGLQADPWNHGQVRDFLGRAVTAPQEKPWALAILGAYLDGLVSRATERGRIADRLSRFEGTLNSLLLDKTVSVGREGLSVTSRDEKALSESHLSSGEFHLLYLMVAALVARRRGSVIAIDEPELSMHISWQRKLIDSLLAVASDARPQLIMATHSPDIVGGYRSHLVQLGPAD
jgi:energy-coupling factor transporter ATP-binding protein EcfA2